MTVPDPSLAVRTPIVVPMGTLLPITRLLMVIAIILSTLKKSAVALCDKLPVGVRTTCRPTRQLNLSLDARLLQSYRYRTPACSRRQLPMIFPGRTSVRFGSSEEPVDEIGRLNASRHEAWPRSASACDTPSTEPARLSRGLVTLHVALIYRCNSGFVNS